MVRNNTYNRIGLIFIAGLAAVGAALAEDSYFCDFNGLAVGKIDGQNGWDVYEKTQDSSAFTVETDLGTTEETWDRALVVASSSVDIRCATDEPIRWARRQTLKIEYDFRLVIPKTGLEANRPVMTLYFGNPVLNEKTRWYVTLGTAELGGWVLKAAMPDESMQTISPDKLRFESGEKTHLSDWLHCVVEVEKKAELDQFSASVRILDRTGEKIVGTTCTDTNKDEVTKAMWSLSRIHAGFGSSPDMLGLVCVDNFRISSEP